MIESKKLTNDIIAEAVGCTPRSITTMRRNFRCFRATRAPRTAVGRPRPVTPPILDALCDKLLEELKMQQHGMVDFLAKEFDGVQVTKTSVSRALRSSGMLGEPDI